MSRYNYTYDDAYRLITETTNMGSANLVTNYQYDRAGNRTQMSNGEGITTYNYNANDELTRVDKPDFYFEDYSYDLRGNLIQVEAGGHGTYSSTNYAYNAKDQMVSYGLGSTPFITYDYNHADNRVAQTVSGTTTNYLWDEFSRYKDVILETNPSNTIGYTLATGMLVSQTNNGNIDYFLQDAQNSTIGIADSSGAVTSSYAYDAFGNLDSSISGVSVETNYLYTGQQFDPVYTELYNLRARQYDPSIGRFSSRDKWAYNLGNPIELNRYGYTANNPVNYSDPSGYSSVAMYATLGLGLVISVLLLAKANVNYQMSLGSYGTSYANLWDFGNPFDGLFSNLVDSLLVPIVLATAIAGIGTSLTTNSISSAFGTQSQGGAIAIPGTPESISIPQGCTGNGNCQGFVDFLLTTGILTLSEAVRRTLRFTIWVDGGSIPNPIPDIEGFEAFGGGRVGEVIRSARYDIFYNGISIAQPGRQSDRPLNTGTGDDLFLSPAFHTYIDISGVAFDSNNLTGVPIGNFHNNLSHGTEVFGVSEMRTGVAWRKCKSYIGATAGNLTDALTTMGNYIGEAQNPFRVPHSVSGNICPTTYSNQAE